MKWVKRYKPPARKELSPGEVMSSMVTIANNAVLLIWRLLKLDLKSFHNTHAHKFLTVVVNVH